MVFYSMIFIHKKTLFNKFTPIVENLIQKVQKDLMFMTSNMQRYTENF